MGQRMVCIDLQPRRCDLVRHIDSIRLLFWGLGEVIGYQHHPWVFFHPGWCCVSHLLSVPKPCCPWGYRTEPHLEESEAGVSQDRCRTHRIPVVCSGGLAPGTVHPRWDGVGICYQRGAIRLELQNRQQTGEKYWKGFGGLTIRFWVLSTSY